MERIPRPMPDTHKLPEHHYLPVDQTPIIDESGMPRKPGDYQPRAVMKKLFDEDKLSQPEEIKEFCDKYVVSFSSTQAYLHHLKGLKQMKEIRSNQRSANKQERNDKTVEDYDWNKLVDDGLLGKLTLVDLNKYLIHHQLSVAGKKADKVRRIIAHVSSSFENKELDINPTSDESDSDEDIVLAEIGSSDAEEDEVDQNEQMVVVEQTNRNSVETRTRSGRRHCAVQRTDYVYY